MRRVIIIFWAILLSSCSERKYIYYEYNGVTITRVDETADSYFYYGKCGEDTPCPKEYIWAEYHGFDGIMGAYLVFQPDKKVKMVRMYDHFEKVGSDSSLFLFDHSENIEFIHWKDSLTGNHDNTIRIADVLSLEKELNKRNKTKVKAVYPKGE